MTISYHAGWDYFTPDAGKYVSMQCKACLSLMNKETLEVSDSRWAFRDIVRRVADKFTCSNSGKRWHDQIIALRKLQRDTPSMAIHDILEKEIEGINTSKLPTKETWGF